MEIKRFGDLFVVEHDIATWIIGSVLKATEINKITKLANESADIEDIGKFNEFSGVVLGRYISSDDCTIVGKVVIDTPFIKNGDCFEIVERAPHGIIIGDHGYETCLYCLNPLDVKLTVELDIVTYNDYETDIEETIKNSEILDYRVLKKKFFCSNCCIEYEDDEIIYYDDEFIFYPEWSKLPITEVIEVIVC